MADLPVLQTLIATSVRSLSTGFYAPAQIEAAITEVFGVDTQLIADRTYYVIVDCGELVAAGGWSGRRTLYGGDRDEGRGGSASGSEHGAGPHSRILRCIRRGRVAASRSACTTSVHARPTRWAFVASS